LEFSLVESLFGYNLTPQILELASQTLLDGVILLAHDFSPDSVQLIKNFGAAGFRDLASLFINGLLIIFYVDENGNCLSGDPIVVQPRLGLS
jgi:hypothetical protein